MSIKVKYAGFWKGFNYTSEPLIYQYLANKYDINALIEYKELGIENAGGRKRITL